MTPIKKDDEAVLFIPDEYQQKILEANGRFLNIDESSTSVTTALCAIALHKAICHPDYCVYFLSSSAKKSKLVNECIRFMHDGLPIHLQVEWEIMNLYELKFGNGSRIFTRPASETAGRGLSISLLVLDDFGSMKKGKELWQCLQPCLYASNSHAIITNNTWFDAGEGFTKIRSQ